MRVGVDTGGTFTDFVVIRDGRVEVFKELSTPQQPEEAIMRGVARLDAASIQEVIHGSTVATNALLEAIALARPKDLEQLEKLEILLPWQIEVSGEDFLKALVV